MNKQLRIIDSSQRKLSLGIKELVDFRELLLTLAYRDFRIKYAQTFLGITWALINPLATLAIMYIVFAKAARIDYGDVPALLFVIAGMCGWQYFSTVLNDAGNSIISNQNMIQKIYFPRLVIPLSKAITGLIDLVIILVIFFVIAGLYGFSFTSQLLFLPLFIGMAIISGLTGGIWLSALTIRYRDFRHVTPLLLRLGMWATPVAYPISQMPEKYKLLFYLNPMTGVVEGVRWCLIGVGELHPLVYVSFIFIIIMFVLGLYFFKRVERVVADII